MVHAHVHVHVHVHVHAHVACMYGVQVPDWLGGKATGWAHGCGGPVPSGAAR